MESIGNITAGSEKTILRTMLTSRAFEEEICRLNDIHALHGTNHVAIGQEAGHTGLCFVLNEDDWIIATHRGHGFYLARTGDVEGMAHEMYGTKYGMCKGLGGSMHFSDMANHYICSTGIVGAGVPIALGAAMNLKYFNKKGIVAAAFGDGASNQGMVFESMNIASMRGLPLLFYCENNQYAVSSPSSRFIANTTAAKRAEGFGIASAVIDGNDVNEVISACLKAKEYILKEQKPFYMEAVTYRYAGHSRSDRLVYRTKDEEAPWREKDPISLYEKYLIERGVIDEPEAQGIRKEAFERVHKAYLSAKASENEHIDYEQAVAIGEGTWEGKYEKLS